MNLNKQFNITSDLNAINIWFDMSGKKIEPSSKPSWYEKKNIQSINMTPIWLLLERGLVRILLGMDQTVITSKIYTSNSSIVNVIRTIVTLERDVWPTAERHLKYLQDANITTVQSN